MKEHTEPNRTNTARRSNGKLKSIQVKSIAKRRKYRKKLFIRRLIVKAAIGITACMALIMAGKLVRTAYNGVVAVFGHDDAVRIDISKDMTGGIPRLYQWDDRWSELAYGTNTMEVSGCGPTCLSMVACGLTGKTKWNPYEVAKMAEEKGYYVPGVGTSWDLMTEGAGKLGLEGTQIGFSESIIRSELEEGHPIICAMGPGDFTTEGHFIVLTGVDEDGKIIINDPNSKELSDKKWELSRLMGQMKNLWSYTMK